jgi:hypothetical protein
MDNANQKQKWLRVLGHGLRYVLILCFIVIIISSIGHAYFTLIVSGHLFPPEFHADDWWMYDSKLNYCAYMGVMALFEMLCVFLLMKRYNLRSMVIPVAVYVLFELSHYL